jgi:hypothetical protein
VTWQGLLSSAVIAGLVSVLGGIVTKILVDTRIAVMQSELNQRLEEVKSELSVWGKFRNETIAEMWKAYRAIVTAMSQVILTMQAAVPERIQEAEPTVEEYRRTVHAQIDLLSPKAVDICQQFLDTAREIASGSQPIRDANALKAIRGSFYEEMAGFFRLGEVMPWITGSPHEVEKVVR